MLLIMVFPWWNYINMEWYVSLMIGIGFKAFARYKSLCFNMNVIPDLCLSDVGCLSDQLECNIFSYLWYSSFKYFSVSFTIRFANDANVSFTEKNIPSFIANIKNKSFKLSEWIIWKMSLNVKQRKFMLFSVKDSCIAGDDILLKRKFW